MFYMAKLLFIGIMCSASLFVATRAHAEDGLLHYDGGPRLSCENGPQKIKDNTEFYLLFGDYNVNDGSLEIISKKPLVIHVYEHVFDNELPQVKECSVKRAILSSIYRVFAFSDIDKIKVTGSAKIVALGKNGGRKLKSPEYTIIKTREQALSDLRKHTKAKSFADLFDKYCLFTRVSNEIFYDDQGGIGITKFFNNIK